MPQPLMRAGVRALVRPVLGPGLPVALQRRLGDIIGRAAVLPAGTHVTVRRLGDRPAERIEPLGADRDRALLFLHGGGYTIGSVTTHRALAAHLAAATAAPVFLLDYRLAPEHPFPAALDDAVAAYDELVASGIHPARVSVAGDSAGGGLALALALRLREEGKPLPGSLGLISPWVDLGLANVQDDARDPMLRRAWLEACARRYTTEVNHPWASPIGADLAGLPPTIVHGSSDEIIRPDVERLVDRLEAAGVTVTYQRLEGLWHVAHLHAGLMESATAAVEQLGHSLRKTIPRSIPGEAT